MNLWLHNRIWGERWVGGVGNQPNQRIDCVLNDSTPDWLPDDDVVVSGTQRGAVA